MDFARLGGVEDDEIALPADQPGNRLGRVAGGVEHLVAGIEAVAGAEVDVVVVGRRALRGAADAVDGDAAERGRGRRPVGQRLPVDEAVPRDANGVAAGDSRAAEGLGRQRRGQRDLDRAVIDLLHDVPLAFGQPTDGTAASVVIDLVARDEVVRGGEGDRVAQRVDRLVRFRGIRLEHRA